MKRKYVVHSVHKISNPCTCSHGHPDHEHVSGGDAYGGRCKRYDCECLVYKPRDVAERELPGEVMDAAVPDLKAIARALREARVLSSGERLAEVKREGAKLVCFPRSGHWQSYIITLAPSELVPTVAIRAEAARVGWPVNFVTDLDHDANAIATMMPREPFTWCLRADGTHMGRVVAPGERGTSLKMHMVAKAFNAKLCRFYVWDGTALRELFNADDADRELARLASRRFVVRTRRSSSLVPHQLPTRREADDLAVQWEQKYGEPFVVTDTWEAR